MAKKVIKLKNLSKPPKPASKKNPKPGSQGKPTFEMTIPADSTIKNKEVRQFKRDRTAESGNDWLKAKESRNYGKAKGIQKEMVEDDKVVAGFNIMSKPEQDKLFSIKDDKKRRKMMIKKATPKKKK